MRKALLAFLIVLAATVNAGKASAHAAPVQYEPDSSSIVSQPPETVRIHFSERIDPGASSLTVYAPNGSEIDDSKSVVDASDAHIFSVGMHGSGSGTYTVSWQVISADDGHFTKGGFIFSVGSESQGGNGNEGQFQVQHRSDWPEAITIWVELLGEAILLGCLALIPTLWRRMKKTGVSEETETLLRRRLRLLILKAGFLLVLGGICYLLLESTNLASDQAVTVSQAFHSFLSTVAGRYTLYRLAIGVVLSLVFAFSLRSILQSDRLTKKEIFLFILIGLIDLMRARVSHAAASPFLPTFSILVNAIHLIFKDLWIGGLVVLIFAFLPAMKKQKDTKLTTLSLLSFSNLLMLALALGGVTGTYIIWLHLKSPANLFTTHWGGYFLTLCAYAFMLLFLRLFQQKAINPSLSLYADGKADAERSATLGMIGALLVTEMFVGLAVLLYSSILIITTPPLSVQHFYEQTISTSNATITFGEHHYETDQFLVTVVRKNQAQTGSGETMTVTLENQEKGIGPLVPKMEERFPGGFIFAKQNLSSPGLWKVNITEQEPHQFDAVASFTLNYPTDITATHRNDESRTFGFFETILGLVAVLIVLMALWLYRENKRLASRLQKEINQVALLPSASFGNLWIAVPVNVLVVIFIGLSFGHNHGGTTMAQSCALVGGQWHENVPMRNGKATSDIAALGCMLGAGQGTFHFIDPRELTYFTRPGFAYATMKTAPAVIKPGQPVILSFHLQDMDGKPVTRLNLEHDRILHTVIVSQDLQTFAHVHVEDNSPVTPQMLKDATFPVHYTFSKPGRYLIGVDYTIGAKTLADTFYVNVGSGFVLQPPQIDTALEKTFDGMQVHLVLPSAPLKSGVIQKIHYTFEQDGKPVTDLQPYLSAAMHMSVVTTDLRKFVHTHAELPQTFLDSIFNPRDPKLTHFHMFLPDRFGPELVAYVLFPIPGQYEIFGEVSRGGKIVVTKFVVTVQ